MGLVVIEEAARNSGYYLRWTLKRLMIVLALRKWINECLSIARVFFLVNGSPTKEFSVGRGLRQEDPFLLFLFVIAIEGLSAMFYQAQSLGLFRGFKVGEQARSISHLQFADDTLILCEKNSQNVWVIKTLLQLFETTSCLKVNLCKSQMIGINMVEDWLYQVSCFLSCKMGKRSSVPFLYHGVANISL